MFGKIMKYEMKSSMKLFLIIWAGLLAVALLGGFVFNRGEKGDNYFFIQNFGGSGSAFQTLMLLLYVALAIGIVALSLIFIIQRFNKGLLGREGYLMFTLPVKTRTLILGKCVSATIVVILSAIAGLLSIVLFVLPSFSGFGEVAEIFEAFKNFLIMNADSTKYIVPVMLMLVLCVILSAVKFIYQVYAAISIGHLVEKHKTLMAVAAYVGISIFESVVGTAVINIIGDRVPFFQSDWNAGFGDPETILILGGVALATVVFIVIYHIITEVILNNRLNLE